MITFTRRAVTYDETDDSQVTVESTVTGEAIQVRASARDLQRFSELELRLTETLMLFFAPTTYGEVPEPLDIVTWPATGGTTYRVRDVDPIAPDGVVIAARVAISR